MRTKEVKGITIISLVVTIVVILILAGVTINVLVGDNGLIKQSKDKTSQAYEKIAREEVKQIVTEYDIANSGESLEEYLKKKVPSRLDEVKRIDDNILEVKKNGYTIEVESNRKEFSIIVVPYTGVYDGKMHNALQSVDVTPSDAKIEYSTDGKTFSENMPQIINASSLNVTVRVSKTGYKTTTVTKVANIDKAEGKLTLSSTSGIYTYPNSGTFTVSGNTGNLSVSSNSTSIATASLSGSTITVKSGTTAGKATITVTSAEASNYKAKSATYEATVNNGTISLSATPYIGTYDGKAHNALTNVSVNPSDAKKEYSINGGAYSTTMPTVTNTSSFTVTVQASKAGYKTQSTTQTVNVNKANGNLNLSSYSGTITYPNSTSFTASGTGSISAWSSNTGVATVSVSGNTVTVKPGTTAGLNWVEKSLQKIIQYDEVDTEKIILGIPFYTRQWTIASDGKIKDRSPVQMMNIKIPNNVEKQWDDDLKQYYIEYASGKNTIKMWIEDGNSIKEKVALVAKYKLGGTSGWRKDMETSNVWSIIKEGLAKASE